MPKMFREDADSKERKETSIMKLRGADSDYQINHNKYKTPKLQKLERSRFHYTYYFPSFIVGNHLAAGLHYN